MKKIGFLGGSFDPPHNGHLHLALRLQEVFRLDEVLFSVAYQSPFKREGLPAASAKYRLEMVQAACSGIAGFSVSDREVNRGGVSYTVDALRELIAEDLERGEKRQFYLLLGEDALKGLVHWKEAPTLLDLTVPLTGTRAGFDYTRIEGFSPEESKKICDGYTSIPRLDISSTEIRSRLKLGCCVSYLLPAKVLDIISHHRLYSSRN